MSWLACSPFQLNSGVWNIESFSYKIQQGLGMAALADDSTNQLIFRIFVVALAITTILVAAVAIYVIRRQSKQQEKIARLTNEDPGVESCKDYQVINEEYVS